MSRRYSLANFRRGYAADATVLSTAPATRIITSQHIGGSSRAGSTLIDFSSTPQQARDSLGSTDATTLALDQLSLRKAVYREARNTLSQKRQVRKQGGPLSFREVAVAVRQAVRVTVRCHEIIEVLQSLVRDRRAQVQAKEQSERLQGDQRRFEEEQQARLLASEERHPVHHEVQSTCSSELHDPAEQTETIKFDVLQRIGRWCSDWQKDDTSIASHAIVDIMKLCEDTSHSMKRLIDTCSSNLDCLTEMSDVMDGQAGHLADLVGRLKAEIGKAHEALQVAAMLKEESEAQAARAAQVQAERVAARQERQQEVQKVRKECQQLLHESNTSALQDAELAIDHLGHLEQALLHNPAEVVRQGASRPGALESQASADGSHSGKSAKDFSAAHSVVQHTAKHSVATVTKQTHVRHNATELPLEGIADESREVNVSLATKGCADEPGNLANSLRQTTQLVYAVDAGLPLACVQESNADDPHALAPKTRGSVCTGKVHFGQARRPSQLACDLNLSVQIVPPRERPPADNFSPTTLRKIRRPLPAYDGSSPLTPQQVDYRPKESSPTPQQLDYRSRDITNELICSVHGQDDPHNNTASDNNSDRIVKNEVVARSSGLCAERKRVSIQCAERPTREFKARGQAPCSTSSHSDSTSISAAVCGHPASLNTHLASLGWRRVRMPSPDIDDAMEPARSSSPVSDRDSPRKQAKENPRLQFPSTATDDPIGPSVVPAHLKPGFAGNASSLSASRSPRPPLVPRGRTSAGEDNHTHTSQSHRKPNEHAPRSRLASPSPTRALNNSGTSHKKHEQPRQTPEDDMPIAWQEAWDPEMGARGRAQRLQEELTEHDDAHNNVGWNRADPLSDGARPQASTKTSHGRPSSASKCLPQVRGASPNMSSGACPGTTRCASPSTLKSREIHTTAKMLPYTKIALTPRERRMNAGSAEADVLGRPTPQRSSSLRPRGSAP